MASFTSLPLELHMLIAEYLEDFDRKVNCPYDSRWPVHTKESAIHICSFRRTSKKARDVTMPIFGRIVGNAPFPLTEISLQGLNIISDTAVAPFVKSVTLSTAQCPEDLWCFFDIRKSNAFTSKQDASSEALVQSQQEFREKGGDLQSLYNALTNLPNVTTIKLEEKQEDASPPGLHWLKQEILRHFGRSLSSEVISDVADCSSRIEKEVVQIIMKAIHWSEKQISTLLLGDFEVCGAIFDLDQPLIRGMQMHGTLWYLTQARLFLGDGEFAPDIPLYSSMLSSFVAFLLEAAPRLQHLYLKGPEQVPIDIGLVAGPQMPYVSHLESVALDGVFITKDTLELLTPTSLHSLSLKETYFLQKEPVQPQASEDDDDYEEGNYWVYDVSSVVDSVLARTHLRYLSLNYDEIDPDLWDHTQFQLLASGASGEDSHKKDHPFVVSICFDHKYENDREVQELSEKGRELQANAAVIKASLNPSKVVRPLVRCQG